MQKGIPNRSKLSDDYTRIGIRYVCFVDFSDIRDDDDISYVCNK